MNTRTRRHRGAKSGGIIWTPHPPLPLSPHQRERAQECLLVWEVCEWLCECWTNQRHAEAHGREPIHMVAALTAWYCSLELPTTRRDVFDGPPILSRRRRPA